MRLYGRRIYDNFLNDDKNRLQLIHKYTNQMFAKLIAKNEVFRIKRGLFALVENEDVISPTTLENIKRLKDELSSAKIKVEDAELQLCIARSHKALAEVAFIEAYQQIASKRMEELKEQLGIDVLVLPAT